MFDRRIVKSFDWDDDGTIDVRGQYVYDGAHVALFYSDDDPASAVNTLAGSRMLWGANVDNLLASESFSGSTSMATYWALTDHQGTVRDLYEGRTTNAIFSHVTYNAFGRPDVVSGALVEFLYTGQQYDFETGLQYSRARYYDPVASRFISQDPISFAAGDANLYRRVGNSPMNATDPSGHFATIVAAGIGAGIGGLIGAGSYLATTWATGEEFRWSELATYTAAGVASGAVAGLTMGASLMVQGVASGAVGGTISQGFTTYAHTGNGAEAFKAGTAGAAIGAITGAAGGCATSRILDPTSREMASYSRKVIADTVGGSIDGLIGGGYDGYAHGNDRRCNPRSVVRKCGWSNYRRSHWSGRKSQGRAIRGPTVCCFSSQPSFDATARCFPSLPCRWWHNGHGSMGEGYPGESGVWDRVQEWFCRLVTPNRQAGSWEQPRSNWVTRCLRVAKCEDGRVASLW